MAVVDTQKSTLEELARLTARLQGSVQVQSDSEALQVIEYIRETLADLEADIMGDGMDDTQFLELGDKVIARVRVYDLPGSPDQGCIHAEPGDVGTVVHTEHGCWPTVRFHRTGTATCVTSEEVRLQ